MNGAKLKDVRITAETRRAIRAGIESEAYRNGKMLPVCVWTPADPFKKNTWNALLQYKIKFKPLIFLNTK